jgi:hypothetical protein
MILTLCLVLGIVLFICGVSANDITAVVGGLALIVCIMLVRGRRYY